MSGKYRFHLRRIEGDSEGYYYPRWDRAQSVTVIAATENEALRKARAMSPELRRPWRWLFQVDRIEEVVDGRGES